MLIKIDGDDLLLNEEKWNCTVACKNLNFFVKSNDEGIHVNQIYLHTYFYIWLYRFGQSLQGLCTNIFIMVEEGAEEN